MTKQSSSKTKPKSVISKSKSKSVPKVKSVQKSQSSKSTKSANSSTSTSLIGASAPKRAKSTAKSGGGKPLAGSSYEASNVKGRPKLCKQMEKVIGTKGAVAIKSKKEMKERGYEVKEKTVGGQEGLKKASGPKDKRMVCKMIELKMCTARYKITMERYSLKIMRFIGKKPLVQCFPKVFDIFLMNKIYYIFMSECSGHSLYDLVVGKQDLGAGRIRKWIRALTEAVRELQKYGIAHRFIKLRHLMLEHDDHLKIVGWSKAVLFYDTKKKKALYQHKERRARKNNFLPPEAFHRLYDPSKADVWSIGVVLISLTTRRYPFHVRAKMKFTSQWRDFVKAHPMNPITRSLANKIFVIDTKKRIHARDMLSHNYFAVGEKQLQSKSLRGKPLHSVAASHSTDKSHAYSSHSASTSTVSRPKSAKRVVSSKSTTVSVSYSGSSKSKSKSGYGSKSSTSTSTTPSRTSKVSKSKIGASQAGSTSTSKSAKSTIGKTNSAVSSGKKPKSVAAPKSKGGPKSSKPKSKVKSKTVKSARPKSVKPKSAKPKSAKPKSSKLKSKSAIPKSTVAGSKTGSKVAEEASPAAGSKLDGVSKQEIEAEADDAQAETDQAAEEVVEPEMDEVAKEAGEMAADGEVAPDGGTDAEGVADELEMAAPEEAKEAATPAEMEALEGQQEVVEEGAAGEVAAAGVGAEEAVAEAGEEAAAEGEWTEAVAEGAGVEAAPAAPAGEAVPVEADPAAAPAAPAPPAPGGPGV